MIIPREGQKAKGLYHPDEIFSSMNGNEREEKKVYALTSPAHLKSLPLTDNELIKRTREGDEVSFAELIRRYEKRIYNLAYRMLRNEEDAADVLQEVFLRAFRHLNKFKGKSSFYTWLYRIALNVSLRKLKKREKEGGKVYIDEKGVSGEYVSSVLSSRGMVRKFLIIHIPQRQNGGDGGLPKWCIMPWQNCPRNGVQ